MEHGIDRFSKVRIPAGLVEEAEGFSEAVLADDVSSVATIYCGNVERAMSVVGEELIAEPLRSGVDYPFEPLYLRP
ncbi:hypothetical protein CKAH01_10710 [Colletotrichum kahawae]|uniref:Uncharacterized protein n=1 Tax=Colletotrichum kahawae TaxID=34407 RepID=A0AAE0CWY2_COLKA|nr:hypothetical protein CKAH01_10710 [Colletotrichum kahawae]